MPPGAAVTAQGLRGDYLCIRGLDDYQELTAPSLGPFSSHFLRRRVCSGRRRVSPINSVRSSARWTGLPDENNLLRCGVDAAGRLRRRDRGWRLGSRLEGQVSALRRKLPTMVEMDGGEGSVAERPLRPMHIAVDVDEVLGSFLSTLNSFCSDAYAIEHELDEFFVYDFKKIWSCSQAEANARVHAFFDSPLFTNGIPPIPGAKDVLHRLKQANFQLSIVTSRQHVIRQPTLEWIERNYSGLFSSVHFGNHYALAGESKPKSEICRSLGAHVLIDDNPRYAVECAHAGIYVLLFDWNARYPWSKTEDGPSHPYITRVHDWNEVEKAISVLAEMQSSTLVR